MSAGGAELADTSRDRRVGGQSIWRIGHYQIDRLRSDPRQKDPAVPADQRVSAAKRSTPCTLPT